VPTQVPGEAPKVTTAQIISYVLSAIGSGIGILVGFFKVYPEIKSRIAKLREAGVKPTIMRVIFLDKTLSKNRPLAQQEMVEITENHAAAFKNDIVKVDAVTLLCVEKADSVVGVAVADASPELPVLSSKQIGTLVRSYETLL
jgi:hypothetical protein